MFAYLQNVQKLALLLIFILPAACMAQENAVSLEDLIHQLMEQNPQIQAAQSRFQAALDRPPQEKALPDPVVSFVSKNASGNPVPFKKLGSDPLSSIGFMWEQEFPYPGKLKLSGKVAEKEADSAGAAVDTERWTVVSELKQAYFEYFRADRSLSILKDSMDFLKQMESISESQYAVGKTIQQDALRAQLEISILNQRVVNLEREKASAMSAINRMLNKPVDSPLPAPADVTQTMVNLPLDQLQQFAAQSPMVREKASMLDREKLNLDLANKQKYPDFMTALEYDNSPNYPDMWEIRFGVKIPLYKSKQNSGIAESAHNVTRAEKDLQATRQETAFNIQNEYLQVQSSEKLLALYQEAVIPQSKLTLEASLSSYQVGKADFLTTLSNFRSVMEYKINYIEELSRHESAIARLEQAVGRPLTSRLPAGGQNHE